MRVLVVGSGGREHALCWAIARSPLLTELFAAPGNAGIAELCRCFNIAAEDVPGLVGLARDKAVDFVVVGPEAPLALGLVDALAEAGIKAFGPGRAAAEIEGSKAFMKDLCAKYGIPTADYELFDEPDAAKEYILRKGVPIVIKADGLAGGKGVTLCQNQNEAFAAIDHLMTERRFGTSGDTVVIEEYLKGEEVSFFALVDGERAIPFASAQDHKAAYDGDQGPNTGGMGAYSPAPVVTDKVAGEIMDKLVLPTIRAMAAEGRPYRGVLFAGVMVTPDGPRILEFNIRFGDPECQPLMLRLTSDLLAVLFACADGRIDEVRLKWRDSAALTVVMAAEGYPGPYRKDTEIKDLDAAGQVEGVVIFHAGTRAENGRVLANGGRVLGVSAVADTIGEARRRAYEAVDLIDWPDGFCRRDIAWRAINR